MVGPQLSALEPKLRQRLAANADVRFRPLRVAGRPGLLLFLVSLADSQQLNRDLVAPLQSATEVADVQELLLTVHVADAEVVPHDPDAVERAVLSGAAVVLVDGVGVVGAHVDKAQQRPVETPDAEKTTRGAKDSFAELLRVNLGLIRSRLKDPRLRVEQTQVGARSQTTCALLYLEDVADDAVLKVARDRLKAIQTDGLITDAHLEEYLAEVPWSPFPQLRTTERPDWVTWEILQGKIAILVDGSATALLGPATLVDHYQSPEDYQHGFWESVYIRVWLRTVAFVISLYLPGLYVALTDVTPDLLPTKLALSIAGSREGVPFPALVEVLFMEVGLELLREAALRMSTVLATTIGIVGGLVLGQAAVQARIVSDIMIIVIALTAMAQYVPPSPELAITWRTIRWLFTLAAAFLGMYGLALISFLMLFHLAGLNSLGVPYLITAGAPHRSIFADGIWRIPLPRLLRRPKSSHPKDRDRSAPYRQPHPTPDLEQIRRGQGAHSDEP